MDHGNQINDLIKYASNNGGFPLYLLYNYFSPFSHSHSICSISYTEEKYGCSIISANYIKNRYAWIKPNNKWQIPRFLDLHPNISYPWFVLGCCSLNLINHLSLAFNDFDFSKMKKFSKNELFTNPKWSLLSNIEEKQQFNEENRITASFSPKFRIIIGE